MQSRSVIRMAVVALGTAAVIAGCGGSSAESSGDAGSARPAATQTTAAPAAAESRPEPTNRSGPSVKVARSDYGPILFDRRRRALYLFTRDAGTRSRCYGSCAAAWPPYIVRATPQAGNGARTSLLGTTRRRDGRRQATYAGHPLYYYVGDREPGQVLCQNVVEFGGTWLVVSGQGKPVR
jgi:predicted lipoprotein with Yx(FWY)xxD motif